MDIPAIRAALAAQLTAQTGITCLAQLPDQVTVPMMAVIPKLPWKYGLVLDGGFPSLMVTDPAFFIAVFLSRAPDIQDVQSQLDGFLGTGATSSTSIPNAILHDPTLGGIVSGCEVTGVDQYGPVPVAGQDYLGGRVSVQVITL